MGNEPNRDRILGLLSAFERAGATIQIPETTTRGDYVNVLPPSSSRRRGRVCSVHLRSGRVEFQTESWSRLVPKRGFDRLEAGNKAARTPDTDNDVPAIIAAFMHEVEETR